MKVVATYKINKKVRARFKLLCYERDVKISDAVEKLMIQAIKKDQKNKKVANPGYKDIDYENLEAHEMQLIADQVELDKESEKELEEMANAKIRANMNSDAVSPYDDEDEDL